MTREVTATESCASTCAMDRRCAAKSRERAVRTPWTIAIAAMPADNRNPAVEGTPPFAQSEVTARWHEREEHCESGDAPDPAVHARQAARNRAQGEHEARRQREPSRDHVHAQRRDPGRLAHSRPLVIFSSTNGCRSLRRLSYASRHNERRAGRHREQEERTQRAGGEVRSGRHPATLTLAPGSAFPVCPRIYECFTSLRADARSRVHV